MTTTARAIVIELPLPPRALSSNGSHGHWRTKSAAAKGYRQLCGLLARAFAENKPDRRRVSYTFGIKGARAGGYYCPATYPTRSPRSRPARTGSWTRASWSTTRHAGWSWAA